MVAQTLAERLLDLAVGLGVSGFLLGAGAATWYRPTLFAPDIADWNVTPWAQLLVSPALLLGGWFLALTVGIGWQAGPGFGLVAGGAAALARHAYGEDAWPARPVAGAMVAVGALLVGYGVVLAVTG